MILKLHKYNGKALEKREGKLGTMIGILLSIVMLLIGIMIVMFGLHIP